MHVVLIGAGLEENLALGYLCAALRTAGHPTEVVIFDDPSDQAAVVRRIADMDPALVGMSVAFQHRVGEFRALGRALRVAGVGSVIVWGGHVPTARSGGVLQEVPEVDVVVRHDGERTLVALADALEGQALPSPVAGAARCMPNALAARLSTIDGLAFRLPDGRPGATPPRPVERDLDTLEPPVRDARPVRHAGLGFAPILSSRGCWQKCTYCSIHTYHRGRGGPRVRFRDMDAVATEMADLYHRQQVRIFCFHDENLFLPTAAKTIPRLRALREGLDRRGVDRIGVVAKCRPDQVTPEVLDEARRLGVVRMYVGVENGSQNGLDHLGRDTDVATCALALERLRDAGVYACFNVLMFEPDTILQDVIDNVAFLRRFPDVPWNFCRAEVYPGTLLEDRLRERGCLRGGLEGMTYRIEDARAELLFRTTAIAFGGRNFGAQSTANALSGLGYLAGVLRHFHPCRASDGFVRDATVLIRRLSADTLARLGEALAFVQSSGATGIQVADFAADLAARVAAADAILWSDIESLRRQMEPWGVARAGRLLAPRTASGFARAAAVLAVTGLASQASCFTDKTTVMDPVPGDIVTGDDSMVLDPLPTDIREEEIQVYDPPPPDGYFSDPGTDPGTDTYLSEMIIDPPPPDGYEIQPVDPLPDGYEIPQADPLPLDAYEVPPVDPPPPDAWEDLPPVDPPPPDVIEDAAADVRPDTAEELPPVDPPPPDFSAAALPRAGSLPLDRSFRVHLSVADAPSHALRLSAMVTLRPGASLHWSALGGRLEALGDQALFTPDGSRPPLVMVTARGPGGRVDVARFLPSQRPGRS